MRWPRAGTLFKWTGGAAAAGAFGYLALAGRAWTRFGHARAARPEERDELLDRFMPVYDVVERHAIPVDTDAAVTYDAARRMDIQRPMVSRLIFRTRELVLGATAPPRTPRGLIEEMLTLGWGVLAERPGREVVVGAVTKPWEVNVVFRALPPDTFASFAEPGYVKIAWTLRADPAGPISSVFRTETRALATDPGARRQFRRYWAFFSPGITVIRSLLLSPLKAEAERVTAQCRRDR